MSTLRDEPLKKAWAFTTGMLLFALVGMVQLAQAQPPDAAKEAAVDRYLRAAPMSRMMEDTYGQIGQQVPVDKREQFIADMRALVKVDRIERIARAAMLNTFTTEELNALADFYSSSHGASAMSKFGVYMGQVMPPLMGELQRAIQELQSREKR